MPRKRTHADALRDDAVEIIRQLQHAGHVAYLAGGCVRDELLGLTPSDFDVATDAVPDRIRALFQYARPVGEHFGVILVRARKHWIEVATFRTEHSYSDNRRPDRVEFTTADNDAARRDFTINALFKDPVRDEIIDYVGGRDDLRRRLIRAVGNPAERLAEDHLRALRAVRFAARFDFDLDPATADAIRDTAQSEQGQGLPGISRERIGNELRLILPHAARARAVRLIHDLHLDAAILNCPHHPLKDSLLDRLPPLGISFAAALAAWMLDLHDRNPDPDRLVPALRRALVLSNDESADLRAILDHTADLRARWPDLSRADRKRLAASPRFPDALAILKTLDPDAAERIAHTVRDLKSHAGGLAPTPFLTGDDLIAELAIPPGPKIGRLLHALETAQLEGEIASRADALAFARRLLDRE